ncbi:MAG: amidohydrolase family protein [Firmicutes bacterium]|nr:amidohydrolase family protein [Bacillota bacterium]MDH7495777.1 amidohydrolase family protein [Bacillota bacterium]
MTQDPRRSTFKGSVLIESGRITRILTSDQGLTCNEIPADSETLDIEGAVLVPALINGHYHLGETIFRSKADGLDLAAYLDLSHNSYLDSRWYEHRQRIHSLSAHIALLEAARQGVGTVCVSRGWEEVRALGLCSVSCYPVIRVRKLEDLYASFDADFARIYERYHSQQVRVGIFVQSLSTVDDEKLLAISGWLREKNDVMLVIHVSETRSEVEKLRSERGMSPFQLLDRLGLLGPRTVCVHCVHVDERDLDLIAERKPGLVLCPVANLKLGDGIPPVRLLTETGAPVAAGTDGLATNNSASVLESAKLCALLGRLSAQRAFDLVTTGAADVLKLPRQGRIEVGAEASVAVFRPYRSSAQPWSASNILSHLVFNFAGFLLETLIVQGRKVIWRGEMVAADEGRLVAQFQAMQAEMERAETEDV